MTGLFCNFLIRLETNFVMSDWLMYCASRTPIGPKWRQKLKSNKQSHCFQLAQNNSIILNCSVANSTFTRSISVDMFSLVISWTFFLMYFLELKVSGFSGGQFLILHYYFKSSISVALTNHLCRTNVTLLLLLSLLTNFPVFLPYLYQTVSFARGGFICCSLIMQRNSPNGLDSVENYVLQCILYDITIETKFLHFPALGLIFKGDLCDGAFAITMSD